jgi:hypothetical protein
MAGYLSRGMKNRVKRRITDRALSAVTADEIYAWLSEAARDITTRQPELTLPELCETQTWDSTTTPPIVAATSNYTLPSNFLWDRGLYYNAAHASADGVNTWARRLAVEGQGPDSLAALRDGNLPTADSTHVYYWIWDGQLNVEVGTVAVLGRIKLYYVKRPPDYQVAVASTSDSSDATVFSVETGAMSDTVDPLVSPLYWRAMEDFAVARCMEMRMNYGAANYWLNQYDAQLQRVWERFMGRNPRQEGVPASGR